MSVCGKHSTCLHRLNSPTAALPVPINSTPLPAPIRALIHSLFISSVALNDVNDLLWTVWESIWTLSNTIRHSAPGCSRGSALLAQHWQIRRGRASGLWMNLEGTFVCDVCGSRLPHVCFSTLLKPLDAICNGKLNPWNTSTWFRMFLGHFSQQEVYWCVFVSPSESVNTMPL